MSLMRNNELSTGLEKTVKETLIARMLLGCLLTAGLCLGEVVANDGGNDSDLLTIGSTAPSLDIEHWGSDGGWSFQRSYKV